MITDMRAHNNEQAEKALKQFEELQVTGKEVEALPGETQEQLETKLARLKEYQKEVDSFLLMYALIKHVDYYLNAKDWVNEILKDDEHGE